MQDTIISADTATTRAQLSWRFMLRDPAHVIALSAGVGLARLAPGTFGTLIAFPVQWWIAPHFADMSWLGVLAAAFLVGIWACGRTGRALGVPDHSAIVWDETVAFLLVLFFIPDNRSWQALAFLLFRAFDIAKPPPIRYFDARWKNGFGVMFDDLLAAFFTLFTLAVIKALVTG
jgi:phosphatidylglycerophosphatase A